MPVAGMAVISYTYTVSRYHPKHERSSDGAVSDLIRAFSWEGFYRSKFGLSSRLFSDSSSNRLRRTSLMFVAMQGGCLRIHLTW